MVTVPQAWPGATVVLLATGPSLTRDDVDYCRGKARVVAINNAYQLAPWADALYATDAHWWHWHAGVPSFTGPKWSLEHGAWKPIRCYPDVQRLRNTGPDGLEPDPSGLRNGRNSGYAAINLAVHYGATRLLLLGYDMHAPSNAPTHFFGEHPIRQPSPYGTFRSRYLTLVAPLAARGVTVINCTPASRLSAFPRGVLRDVLPASTEVAA